MGIVVWYYPQCEDIEYEQNIRGVSLEKVLLRLDYIKFLVGLVECCTSGLYSGWMKGKKDEGEELIIASGIWVSSISEGVIKLK